MANMGLCIEPEKYVWNEDIISNVFFEYCLYGEKFKGKNNLKILRDCYESYMEKEKKRIKTNKVLLLLLSICFEMKPRDTFIEMNYDSLIHVHVPEILEVTKVKVSVFEFWRR